MHIPRRDSPPEKIHESKTHTQRTGKTRTKKAEIANAAHPQAIGVILIFNGN